MHNGADQWNPCKSAANNLGPAMQQAFQKLLLQDQYSPSPCRIINIPEIPSFPEQ